MMSIGFEIFLVGPLEDDARVDVVSTVVAVDFDVSTVVALDFDAVVSPPIPPLRSPPLRSPPIPDKISKRLVPPAPSEERSSMLVRPETLLISVFSLFDCNTAPQLKQIDCCGIAVSTSLLLLLFCFSTVAGASQFGQAPEIVLTFCHTWNQTVATRGRTNIKTKNEFNRPNTSPPNGEIKNPTIRAIENAPFAIFAISSFPPPPPDGGRLYIDRRI